MNEYIDYWIYIPLYMCTHFKIHSFSSWYFFFKTMSWLRTLQWAWSAEGFISGFISFGYMHHSELPPYNKTVLVLAFEDCQCYSHHYSNLHPDSVQWFGLCCILPGVDFWSFWSKMITFSFICISLMLPDANVLFIKKILCILLRGVYLDLLLNFETGFFLLLNFKNSFEFWLLDV